MAKRGRPKGVTKKTGKKPLKISSSELTTIKPIEDRTEFYCSCCGKKYNKQKGNFAATQSVLYKGNNGYLTVCKTCTENYYKQLLEIFSSDYYRAIEHCCRVFDWYYSDAIVNMTKNATGGVGSRVLLYPSKTMILSAKGTTYLDTVIEQYENKVNSLEEASKFESKPEENTENNNEEPIENTIPQETIKFFGVGYTREEYLYLQEQYDEWTSRYECNTKAHEEIFKNLCITQLTIQKATQKQAHKELESAMKIFQDLMGSANIKPSQNNDNSLAEQNTFGTLIRKWETTDPIGEPDEAWKDVDNIYQYIDVFFKGHMCKILHVENDTTPLYDETMAKYTAIPPVYEADEAGETSIFDKYSDKGSKLNDESDGK